MTKRHTYRPIPLALTFLIATISAVVALAVSGGQDAHAHERAGQAALRSAQAQLAMLRDGIKRGMTDVRVPADRQGKDDGRLPPYFWAAFTLSGDWR